MVAELLYVAQASKWESEGILFASWQLQDTPAEVRHSPCSVGLVIGVHEHPDSWHMPGRGLLQ